jgi:hypothetical protein
MARSDIVDVQVVFLGETDNAFRVEDDEEHILWLPKSHVETTDDLVSGSVITVSMPEWLAEEKGLV